MMTRSRSEGEIEMMLAEMTGPSLPSPLGHSDVHSDVAPVWFDGEGGANGAIFVAAHVQAGPDGASLTLQPYSLPPTSSYTRRSLAAALLGPSGLGASPMNLSPPSAQPPSSAILKVAGPTPAASSQRPRDLTTCAQPTSSAFQLPTTTASLSRPSSSSPSPTPQPPGMGASTQSSQAASQHKPPRRPFIVRGSREEDGSTGALAGSTNSAAALYTEDAEAAKVDSAAMRAVHRAMVSADEQLVGLVDRAHELLWRSAPSAWPPPTKPHHVLEAYTTLCQQLREQNEQLRTHNLALMDLLATAAQAQTPAAVPLSALAQPMVGVEDGGG